MASIPPVNLLSYTNGLPQTQIISNPGAGVLGSGLSGVAANQFLSPQTSQLLQSANQANSQLGAANISAAGGLAQTTQQGLNQLADTGLRNTGAENVANIQGATQRDVTNLQNTGALNVEQARGQNTLANTGLGGQYSLAGADLAGRYQLAGEDTRGKYGLQEAQIAAMPGLINSAIGLEKFNTFFPTVKNLLGQVSGFIGGAGNYLNPSLGSSYTTGGGFNTPQGVNVPSSVISPGQATALVGQGAIQGNVGTANQFGNLAQGLEQQGGAAGSPLEQQLANQLSAQNSAALQQAATAFRGQLAPANAQQGLGYGQLAELQRSNQAKEQLGLLGQQTQRYGGLIDAISGLAGGGLRLGGL